VPSVVPVSVPVLVELVLVVGSVVGSVGLVVVPIVCESETEPSVTLSVWPTVVASVGVASVGLEVAPVLSVPEPPCDSVVPVESPHAPTIVTIPATIHCFNVVTCITIPTLPQLSRCPSSRSTRLPA
jgi:hypothetical protein